MANTNPENLQMEPRMIARIEAVLARVKDPGSDLPVACLGLVRKVRYNAAGKKLYVFANQYPPFPKCLSCLILDLGISSSLWRDLQREFAGEFPDLEIEWV
jgi:metal-sulfur cluster biosynthetic enzyme